MARYQVILAYDGTEFQGFQRQARSKNSRTVQAEVEAALHNVGWEGEKILAAGRTDAGVHAGGQVIAFDLDWSHQDEDLLAALNAHLPFDVAVTKVCQAEPEFHPRYDALARHYRYRIYCQPLRDPLRERYAWRIWPAVDMERIMTAAALLPGTHDFGAFGTPPRSGGSTVRQVMKAVWKAQADEVIFDILGDAFLYRMVRRLVAFQVDIGQGRLDVGSIADCLQTGKKELVKSLAPARGLNLVEVKYLSSVESSSNGTLGTGNYEVLN